jgi:hypothetical protein
MKMYPQHLDDGQSTVFAMLEEKAGPDWVLDLQNGWFK